MISSIFSSNKAVVLSFFSLILFSCNTNNKEIIAAFRTMEESMEVSNNTTAASNQLIIASIQMKQADFGTAERATIQYPKAQRIRKLTVEIIKYIELLKDSLRKEADGRQTVVVVNDFFKKKGTGDELYEKLLQYKEDILATSSDFKNEFDNSLQVTTKEFEKGGMQNFTKTFFYNIPVAAALAVLTKFNNNIYTIEYKILIYLNSKIYPPRICTFMSAFVVQNSTCVSPGEYIEITSGVGEMRTDTKTSVTIKGKRIPLDGSGTAFIRFRSSSKPGKYAVPVEVSFIDQDGKQKTMSKNITYTVLSKETGFE